MKISNCIHELLLENETVIIPGFGAFISHYKPAEIRPETNEIKPPYKELSFNEKIRNNDGLLVGYIAGKEGISHFDALKEIEKDRENIIYQLDKGEKITFDNVGILFRNEKKEIEFDSFQEENLLLDSFGLEGTPLNQLLSEVGEENKDKQEIQSPNYIEEKIESDQISETILDEPERKTNIAEEKLMWETFKKDAPHLLKKYEKKKIGWPWLLLFLIPIFVGAYFFYTNQYKSTPPTITEGKKITESELKQLQESHPKDSVLLDTMHKEITGTEQNDTLQSVQSTELETTDHGNYYLVGGSFKEEENADKFLEEFEAEGYTPFKLGKRGNFYIVALGRYNTEKEAVEAQNKFIEENPDSGTWVYEDKSK